jgi:bifunctional non-homologous end joining protein LigD
MPVRWVVLSRLSGAAAFVFGNAAARMRRLKAHPWQGIDALKQGLPRANKPARKSRTRK